VQKNAINCKVINYLQLLPRPILTFFKQVSIGTPVRIRIMGKNKVLSKTKMPETIDFKHIEQ